MAGEEGAPPLTALDELRKAVHDMASSASVLETNLVLALREPGLPAEVRDMLNDAAVAAGTVSGLVRQMQRLLW